MRKIFDFLKKYWLFILLAMVVFILLALRLSQGRQALPSPEPELSPIFGNLPQPKSGFAEILGQGPIYDISLTQPNFDEIPRALPVYKIKKFSREEILSRLAKTISGLGFLETPIEEQREDGRYLVWREKENYLKVNIESGQFSFVGKALLSSGQLPTFNEVKSLIEETLFSWNLTPIRLEAERIEGFLPVGMELSPVTDLSRALFYKVFFAPSFDGYSLIGVGPASNLIEVTISKNGEIVSLFFNLHQVDKEIVGNYSVKSFEETVRELKEGEAQIILVLTSEGEDRSIPPKDQIQEVQISSLEVVYYETVESQDFYQPVLLLKGKIILKNKEEYQALFILSAIVEKYLAP